MQVYLLFVYTMYMYMYCCWILIFQRGKRGPINRFHPATFVCLSQAWTWISSVICRGIFCVQWVQLSWEVINGFVDIGGIDDHHCLYVIFITANYNQHQWNIYCWLLFNVEWAIFHAVIQVKKKGGDWDGIMGGNFDCHRQKNSMKRKLNASCALNLISAFLF